MRHHVFMTWLSPSRAVSPDGRGVDGALLDLEYQRMELLKFNLFDNYTFQAYVNGRDGVARALREGLAGDATAAGQSALSEVGGAASEQVCGGELIRYRTLTGICNDILNPLMGSTEHLFARNVQFEETFPLLGRDRARAQPPRRPASVC